LNPGGQSTTKGKDNVQEYVKVQEENVQEGPRTSIVRNGIDKDMGIQERELGKCP
jgi:hypothetical protein